MRVVRVVRASVYQSVHVRVYVVHSCVRVHACVRVHVQVREHLSKCVHVSVHVVHSCVCVCIRACR